jgi:hypothetical protein
MKSIAVAVVSLCFCLSSAGLAEQHQHSHEETVISGTLSFPISCPTVQQQFDSAVAALHSFEYEVAGQQFQAIEKKDAGCGIAYWGQAMSLFHQLWSRPTDAELTRGAELLATAQNAKTLSARERDYVAALQKFYANPQQDHEARAAAYSEAMAGVYKKYPRDTEAAVFYALSLLASAPDHDPELKNARRAVEILNVVDRKYPRHPGVAHYIIHSTDNPQLASLGLEAARRYAQLAPESPHAVHMPSHIFARLGLWRDDIASNVQAVAAANKLAHLHVEHHKMHSTDFLHYAYLQMADDAKAQEMAAELQKIDRKQVPQEFVDFYDSLVADFASRYALERRDWKEALALGPDLAAHPFVHAITYLGRAIAAGHLRDTEAAAAAAKNVDEMVEATKKTPQAYYAKEMENGQKEARAWAMYAAGDVNGAATLLGQVADYQDKVGKGETELPAREMLADMLLEANRPADALRNYEISLKVDPNRFNGLNGAAQAAARAGKPALAQSYQAQLLKTVEGVRSDRAESVRAKAPRPSVDR